MAEDISAQMRLGVEIATLGALLMTITTLLYMGLSFLRDFETKTIKAVQAVSLSQLINIQNEEYMTSANIYKVITTAGVNVESIEVCKNDGTTIVIYDDVDDFIKLLHNASTNYSVTVTKSAGIYKIKLVEVT